MIPIDVSEIAFNEAGLVPAIIQDDSSRTVLMLGYMNAESLSITCATGRVVFWSRSRQELWRKGDTSGHVQLVRDIRVDCDSDTLLISVEQIGPACHTGTPTCFDSKKMTAITSLSKENLS